MQSQSSRGACGWISFAETKWSNVACQHSTEHGHGRVTSLCAACATPTTDSCHSLAPLGILNKRLLSIKETMDFCFQRISVIARLLMRNIVYLSENCWTCLYPLRQNRGYNRLLAMTMNLNIFLIQGYCAHKWTNSYSLIHFISRWPMRWHVVCAFNKIVCNTTCVHLL